MIIDSYQQDSCQDNYQDRIFEIDVAIIYYNIFSRRSFSDSRVKLEFL